MADPMSDSNTRCPWCSAELPDPGAEQCPSCGAILVAAPDTTGDIKGVTTLDTEAILRARSELSRPRNNRLLSFITGEAPVDMETAANPESLATPSAAVRREMLRLQLEAEQADLEAETVALKADELTRRGIHLSQLGGDEPAPEPDANEAAATGEAAEGDWPAELAPDEPEAPSEG
jgi:hypothetical protein